MHLVRLGPSRHLHQGDKYVPTSCELVHFNIMSENSMALFNVRSEAVSLLDPPKVGSIGLI